MFAPRQSLCESTAFAETCSAGCCCLPEPSLAVGETRIQRKSLCLGISPVKALRSLGKQSWVWECCYCLPELVSGARWKILAWSEIPFALAYPLPEREAKSGEGSARRPRRREGAVVLGVRKRSGSRIACRGTNSRPVAKQVPPAPCAERWNPGCYGDMRGRLGQRSVNHSEEGVWGEGRPVLCLWSQGEIIPLATCPKGRLGLATRCYTRNTQKQNHGETGSQMPSSTKMWQRCGWQGVCRERSGDWPPQFPVTVHGLCAVILSLPLSCGEGTGLDPESA